IRTAASTRCASSRACSTAWAPTRSGSRPAASSARTPILRASSSRSRSDPGSRRHDMPTTSRLFIAPLGLQPAAVFAILADPVVGLQATDTLLLVVSPQVVARGYARALMDRLGARGRLTATLLETPRDELNAATRRAIVREIEARG